MMVGVLPADPQERAAKAANMPLKRIGEPEDCAGPAVFLASAASDFMSGQDPLPRRRPDRHGLIVRRCL